MKITILTLFPEMFTGPFDYSIMKRAQQKELLEIAFLNIRDFGEGKHKVVDDTAYGGGVGMVMKVDVLHRAIQVAKNSYTPTRAEQQKIILLSASGKQYTQQTAKSFAQLEHLILICGHYEGIDDRIKKYIDKEVAIGEFVLTGGELPSMLIVDSVVRLISGVLPEGATEDESFAEVEDMTVLEYPHYTSPRSYDGQNVPEVLLSGNHKHIETWRGEQSLIKTRTNRPELLKPSKA